MPEKKCNKSASLTPLEKTAVLTALWRVMDQEREDSLISDEFARLLVDKLLARSTELKLRSLRNVKVFVDIVAYRTRSIDLLMKSFLDEFCETRSKPTYCYILGSGLDTRGWRNTIKEVNFVECDRAKILKEKFTLLKPHWEGFGINQNTSEKLQQCDIPTAVPVDFVNPAILAKALRDSRLTNDNPCVWIIEGVLEYFEPSLHQRIFAQLPCAKGSVIIIALLTKGFVQEMNALGFKLKWKPLPGREETLQKLRDTGWDSIECLSRAYFESMREPILSKENGLEFMHIITARKA